MHNMRVFKQSIRCIKNPHVENPRRRKATTLQQLLEICSSTLRRTQLRDYSSATNVIKLIKSRGDLVRHKQAHNEVRYNCLQCDKSFSRKGDLKRHSIIHTGEKPHKCTQCNFSCSDYSNLIRHIRKHTGQNLYQCNHCEYKSTHPGYLQTRKKMHAGEKPQRCTICNYSCITAGTLKVHMIRKHAGENLD